MNNRDNLLDTALELFSIRGYEAVSVREICGRLGLKESALYYHFKNKEALLEALYEAADSLTVFLKARFERAFTEITAVGPQEMRDVAVDFLKNYYCDRTVSRLISMLSVERLRDEKAAEQYERLVYSLPVEHCTGVFAEMVKRGIVAEGDPETMAEIYCSIVISAWSRFCTDTRRRPERQKLAEAAVSEAVGMFYEGIRRKKE